MEENLRNAVKQAKLCKVGFEEMSEILEMIYREEKQ